MKRLLALPLSVAALSSFATVHTVSNNPLIPAEYIDLDTAITYAQNGDSLYIHGSTTFYYVTLTSWGKQLHMFGPGYRPRVGYPATIAGTMYTNPGTDDGSSLNGLIIENQIGLSANWSIKNCQFNGQLGVCNAPAVSVGDNSLVQHNVFNLASSMGISAGTNCLITNNVFRSDCGAFSNALIGSASLSQIVNNLFIFGDGALLNISGSVIANNIFWGATLSVDENLLTSNQFANNIAFTTSSFPGGTNTSTGNLASTDPQFVSATEFELDLDSADYHLAPGSPGSDAGTDGTDIGIYGGVAPMPEGFTGQALPAITEFLILNPVIQEGTGLDVTIKAKARP